MHLETKLNFNIVSKLLGMLFTSIDVGCLIETLPVQLRLRLFSSVVTPSVLFGSSVLSLTQTQLHRLGTVQRRMLRNIIGWVRVDGEDWHDTMSRMKSWMARASLQFLVTPWEFQFHKAQWSYAIHASRCSNTSWIDSVSR